MTLDPLLESGWLITLHASTALLSLILGVYMFARPKGTLVHRTLGYTWIAAMAIVVLSSLFINQIRTWGPFSPIHLLTLITAIGLFGGWRAARRHDIKNHRLNMIILWFGALGLNIWFTLLPGRVMHEVVFGLS
jgi:uncharacterized membrane protein